MRIRVFSYLLIFAIAGAAFFSCKKTTSQALRDQEVEYINGYAAKYMKDAKKTTSGIYYLETKAGKDTITIKAGDLIKIFYNGYLIQDTINEGIKKGAMFDSSGDYEPFSFVVGAGTVITGWDEAIRLMKDGGEATWLIPSRLAYSAQPQNGIPAYSPLVFDVRIYRVYRADSTSEFPVISKKPPVSF
jgi:FKBP-type peptidyl-prolyl cis-trans isomerase